MKKVKRITMLFAFIMIVTMLMSAAAFAEDKNDHIEEAEDIKLNDVVEITRYAKYNERVFKFTPAETAIYIFKAGRMNGVELPFPMSGEVFTDTERGYDQIAYDVFSGEDRMFFLSFQGEKGKDYYLVTKPSSVEEAVGKGYTVTLIKHDIKSISYKPAKDIVIEEGKNGGDVYDDDIDEYYFYYADNAIYFQDEDELTVTDTNNNSTVYRYNSEEEKYISGEKIIPKTSIKIDVYCQGTKHWNIGSGNEFDLIYLGISTKVPVTIVKNDIESIEFTNVEPYKYEERDPDSGEYEKNGKGEEYFKYKLPDFKLGDVLKVTRNGITKSYTLKENINQFHRKQFICDEDENDVIDKDLVNMRSMQRAKPWLPGTNNVLPISYACRTYDVPVTITPMEHNIKKIDFTPITPYSFVENDKANGQWANDVNDDTFFKYTIKFHEGDKLKITDNNDVTTEYIYQYSGGYGKTAFFTDDLESMIPPSKITNDADKNQYNKAWHAGENIKVVFTYKDVNFEQPVKISHVIKKVDFKKASDTEAGHIAHWECEKCRKCFSDEKGTKEVDRSTVNIPKNKFNVTPKKSAFTVKAGKKKKLKATSLYTVKSKKGAVTYKKSSGSGKITVAKNGNITVKKGLKKGKTYKVIIKATTAATAKYKACTRAVTLKIKIK